MHEATSSEKVYSFLTAPVKSNKRTTIDDAALPFAMSAWTDSRLRLHGKENLFVDWALWATNQSLEQMKGTSADSSVQSKLTSECLSFLLTVLNAAVAAKSMLSPPRTQFAHILSGLFLVSPQCDEKLLSVAISCFECVRVKKALRVLHRPSLDAEIILIKDACEALMSQTEQFSRLALPVMLHTQLSLVANTNQKKVFQLVNSKLLAPLILLHNKFTMSKDSSTSDVQTVCLNMIQHNIFHKEHMSEFVAVLQHLVGNASHENSLEVGCANILKALHGDAKSKAKTSYPKQFFDQLCESIKKSRSIVVIFPDLLNAFIESRRKHVKVQDANLVFSPDFAFFLVLFTLLLDSAKPSPNQNSAKVLFSKSIHHLIESEYDVWSIERTQNSITAQLIRVVVDRDVYQATQDQVSTMQLAMFKSLSQEVVGNLVHLDESKRGIVFHILGALVRIDHSIVMDSMDPVWPLLALPGKDSEVSAIDLTTLLFETLTKSRELEIIVTHFLSSAQKLGDSKTSILTNDRILETLSKCVSKTLPAQIPALFDVLLREFYPSEMQSGEEGIDASAHPSRRRRMDTSFSPLPEATVVIPQHTHILTQWLRCLINSGSSRVATSKNLVDAFESRLGILFDHILTHLIHMGSDIENATTKKRNHSSIVSHSEHLPNGLNLLLTIMKSSDAFWKAKISTAFILQLVQQASPFSIDHAEYPVERLLKVRIALFHAECVASSSMDPRMETRCADLITIVLNEFVPSVDSEARWNGTIRELTTENYGVPVYAALFDHLVPICHLATTEQLEGLVEKIILFLQLRTSDQASDSIMMGDLCVSLLQSAQFYELRAIRDIWLPALVSRIISTFLEAIFGFGKGDGKATLGLLNELKAESKSMRSFSTRIAEHLAESDKNKVSTIQMDSRAMTAAIHLVSILNLFPTCYFTNSERDYLVGVLFVLDRVFSKVDGADDVQVLRGCAVCRRLAARFMESREDTLLTLYSCHILNYYLTSLMDFENVCLRENKGVAMQYQEIIRKETFFIQDISFRKLFQKMGATLQKGSLNTPEDFITATVSFLSNAKRDENWYGLVKHYLQSVAQYLVSIKSDSTEVQILDPTMMEVDGAIENLSPAPTKPSTSGGAKKTKNHTESVIRLSSNLLQTVQEFVLQELNALAGGAIVTEEKIRMMAVFEQLVLFGEVAGKIEGVRSYEELIDVAQAAMKTVSSGSEAATPSAVRLASYFCTIQFHLRESDATIDSEIVESMAISATLAIKNAWGRDANSVISIHESIIKFCQKSISPKAVQEFVSVAVSTVELLMPTSLGSDAHESDECDFMAAFDFLSVLVTGSQKSGKRSGIRKNLHRMFAHVTRVIDGSEDVNLVMACVTMLTRLCEDRNLEMQRSDISLILNALSLLSSKHNALSNQKTRTILDANDLFEAVCRLIISILSHRRDALIDSIPALVGLLRGLLHCFKQDLGGIRATEGGGDGQNTFIQTPYPFFAHGRLKNPVAAAESLSRVFEKMNQKAAANVLGNAGKSSAGATASGTAAAAAVHLQSSAAATVRPFAKHAGFLVSEYVSIQASMAPVPMSVKAALANGVYALLDLCGDFGRKAVLAGLDALQGMSGPAKLVFKETVVEWQKYSSYRGEGVKS
ncbi:Urb2/Npa2 family-domain-containing protein, partial [Chytriomyces cf. hyalinus JEL632]